MYRSPHQTSKRKKTQEKAAILYKEGLSLREISKVIERSHEWVRQALIREGVYLSTGQGKTQKTIDNVLVDKF